MQADTGGSGAQPCAPASHRAGMSSEAETLVLSEVEWIPCRSSPMRRAVCQTCMNAVLRSDVEAQKKAS